MSDPPLGAEAAERLSGRGSGWGTSADRSPLRYDIVVRSARRFSGRTGSTDFGGVRADRTIGRLRKRLFVGSRVLHAVVRFLNDSWLQSSRAACRVLPGISDDSSSSLVLFRLASSPTRDSQLSTRQSTRRLFGQYHRGG